MRWAFLPLLPLLLPCSAQVYDDWILARARRGDPHCIPQEQHKDVAVGDPVKTLMPLGSRATDRVRIHCAVIDVRRHEHSSDNVCGAQNTLPYRIYVVAEMPSRTHRWPVNSLLGGSLDEVVYSTGEPANYSLVFYNDHQAECDYHVTWSVDFCVDGKAGCRKVSAVDVQYTLPTLTSFVPSSIYLKDVVTFTFLQAREPHELDRAKAIHRDAFPEADQVDPCSYDGELAHHMQRGEKEDWMYIVEEGLSAVYRHRFETVGLYYICYAPHQPGDVYDYQEVAQISVFGGNPDYFVMSPPSLTHSEWRFTFYGEHLDVRPHVASTAARVGHGDRAKIVNQSGDCSDEQAPGVPGPGGTLMDMDLGPDNSPNSHLAYYDVTFKYGGRFRVCYQRFETPWIEVPNIEDLPEGFFTHRQQHIAEATPSPSDQGHATPAPTQGLRFPSCQPYSGQPVNVKSKSQAALELTVAKRPLPPGFHEGLTRLLGVPGEVAMLTGAAATTYNGQPALSVSVDIHCSLYMTPSGIGCSSRQKRDLLIALVLLHHPCMAELGVVNVTQTTAKGALICVRQPDGTCKEDQPPPPLSGGSSGTSPFVVFLEVLAVIAALSGMVFAGVWMWNRHKYSTSGEMIASMTKGVPLELV